jgi:hypothetical protein
MKFYVLKSPEASEGTAITDFLTVDAQHGEAPRCPLCGGYIGMMPTLPPVMVELELWEKTFCDLSFGNGNQLLVSSRFWDLWQASGLSGLDDIGIVTVKKVRPRLKIKEPVPTYRCCRVQRSRATINIAESGLEHEGGIVCEECRLGGIIQRARKIVLDADSWSGEDVFYARGLPGTMLASERFEEFIRKNRVTGCQLISADEFAFDYYKTK